MKTPFVGSMLWRIAEAITHWCTNSCRGRSYGAGVGEEVGETKQAGGLQICTRVELMKQVDETFPGRLPPPQVQVPRVGHRDISATSDGNAKMYFHDVLNP